MTAENYQKNQAGEAPKTAFLLAPMWGSERDLGANVGTMTMRALRSRIHDTTTKKRPPKNSCVKQTSLLAMHSGCCHPTAALLSLVSTGLPSPVLPVRGAAKASAGSPRRRPPRFGSSRSTPRRPHRYRPRPPHACVFRVEHGWNTGGQRNSSMVIISSCQLEDSC